MTYLCEIITHYPKVIHSELIIIEEIKEHKQWAKKMGYTTRYFKLVEVKELGLTEKKGGKNGQK